MVLLILLTITGFEVWQVTYCRVTLLDRRLCCPLPAHVAECCEDLVWCWIGGENGSGVTWRIPGITNTV